MSAHNLLFPAWSSHIWSVCAGQPQLVSRITYSEPERASTLEGIVAHWVAGCYLRGEPVTRQSRNDIAITEEMHDGALLMLNHVNSILANCSEGARKLIYSNIEYYVYVNWLMPSVHKQITDLRHYDPKTKTLYIWDYKFGHEYVEVVENTQEIYYALDAATKDYVEEVVVFIIQPRAYCDAGPIRSWRFDRATLNSWAGRFKQQYNDAHRDDAPLVVGSHCKRCKARGLCPAFYEDIIKLATVLDAPPSLTPAEVGERLKLMELLNTRSGEAKSALHSQGVHYVQQGVTLPGWKLIPATTKRKVTDEPKLIALFTLNGGKESDLYVKSLKPLGQLEKLVSPLVVDSCTTKPKGALILVPDEHASEGFQNKVAAVFNTEPVKPTGAI